MTDVLIIGGGIAGLAAALTLARQQHKAIVFDSEVYRNAPSSHMHNVLTWDRSDPKEFRRAAKANILEGYSTIQFKNVEITSIEKNNESNTFKATDKSGKEWEGRKVILATGVRDIFPDIEGYAENFAKSMYANRTS
jgi:thioredoxin reductase